MSSVKNPEEKKLLSLKHDRRNVYGENAKSSRKNIPRSKRLSQKAARTAVAHTLVTANGLPTELDLEKVEMLVLTKEKEGKRNRFKKQPDAPLFKVLLENKTDMPKGTLSSRDNSLKTVARLRNGLRSPAK